MQIQLKSAPSDSNNPIDGQSQISGSLKNNKKPNFSPALHGLTKSVSCSGSANYDSNIQLPATKAPFLSISRLFTDEINHENYKYLDIHSVSFKCDRELLIIGFSQYLMIKSSVQVTLQYVLIEGDSLDSDEYFEKKLNILSQGDTLISRNKISARQKSMPILFESPIKIEKNQFYTLKVMNTTKNVEFLTYKGVNGFEKNYPFSFYVTRSPDYMNIKTCVKSGQIPELLYNNIN